VDKRYRNPWDHKEVIQSYLMISGSVAGLIVFVVIPLIWILRFCMPVVSAVRSCTAMARLWTTLRLIRPIPITRRRAST